MASTDRNGRREHNPNWLPLPGVRQEQVVVPSVVDEQDAFCKANVESYFPGQRVGVLKNMRGQILPFSLSEAEVKGDLTRLASGKRVGYDASWTSRGMRVTMLRIY